MKSQGAPSYRRDSTRNVVIIGASAAGLYAASRLARSGLRTAVIERAASLDPAPRALIVTHRLRDFIGPVDDGVVTNQVHRFELFADGKVADVELGRPDLIIERQALIKQLAERAHDDGVELELGTRFKGLAESNGTLRYLASRKGSEPDVREASCIVGADGSRSKVARAAGWAPQPTVSLVQAIVERPSCLPDGSARVWFRPDDTPYFYWLIPEIDGRAALGVIGGDPSEIRVRLNAFADELSLKVEEYQAAVVPAYERWIPVRRRLQGGDVCLVGDAAGQVKVSTVGGIVTGFRGAAAVADMVATGRSAPVRALRSELFVHLMLRKVLSAFTEDDYRYLIGGLDERAKASLRRTDRDRALRAVLGFVRSRPGVVLRAIRALIAT